MQKAGEAGSKKPAVDEKYIRPKAAAERMKAAQAASQTVYLYGPTGLGKTSFAAEYLSRRRYEYYSMAEMCVSEILPSGMENGGTDLLKNRRKTQGPGRIVVVDDLQWVLLPEEREIIFRILESLSEDKNAWLILISRCPLPAWLKPLHFKNIFVMIGPRELRLDPGQAGKYLEKWNLELMQKPQERLLSLCAGHPLCLRIAALRLCGLGTKPESSEERVRMELAAIEEARKDWWDYLETGVYDQWEPELQEFLMDVSIVEEFDLSMAQFLTKKNDAGRLITLASEIGDFLTEHKAEEKIVYELELPLRLSMRRRLARRCGQPHIDGLYLSAGNCYELEGNLPKALEMYEKGRCEEGISRLLSENARKYAGSGHYWEFRRYYLSLSEEVIKTSPELIAGMSLLQSIMMNDEESERWYHELETYIKNQSGSHRRAAQARLLYLDIVLPQRGTRGMTEALKHAWTFFTQKKLLLPEVSLTNNQPSMMNGGKDFCEWSRCDRELAASIGRPVELLLGKFGKGLVNLALAESFLEKGGDSYEIMILAQKGRMQAESGGKPEQVFVGVGLLAWLALLNGHLDDALESLGSFAKSVRSLPQLAEGVDTMRTRLLLYGGNIGETAAWMDTAPDEDMEFCTLERFRYVTKARVYLAMGRREKAKSLLERLTLYAEKRERTYLKIETELLLAVTQFRLGEEEWMETLQKAVIQAEDYHFVRILTREGAAVRELLKSRELHWQDPDFQKQVLSECGRMERNYPSYLNEKKNGRVLLSDKALQILRLQAQGLSVAEISEKLGLSSAGVKYYNQETYKKLGVSSKAAAVHEARSRKLI